MNWSCIRALCSAACVLLPCVVGAQRRTQSSSGLATADRATQIVTDTLVRALAAEIESAHARRHPVAYLIALPADSAHVHWPRVRRTLLDTLHARESTDADTIVQTLVVDIRAAAPSALTINLLTGAKWKCGAEWRGGSSAREIFISFDQSASPPKVVVQQFSDSLPCTAGAVRN